MDRTDKEHLSPWKVLLASSIILARCQSEALDLSLCSFDDCFGVVSTFLYHYRGVLSSL